MGLWKRVSEKTKQTFGVKANTADWKPTSNGRNLAMIEEARRFSKELKKLHKELRDMEGRIQENMGVLKSVLNAPLPRVFEFGEKGPVAVDRGEGAIVGAGVAFDVLSASGAELKAKLQEEVLHPLDQWQAAYRMIKQRNLKCEELRLELDAKRREAVAMSQTLERQKTKAAVAAAAEDGKGAEGAGGSSGGAGASSGGGAPSPNNKFEDAEFRLLKEEDKVTRLTERFRAVEGEVYSALLTLINDTAVLKQYAAAALVVYQHAFAHAYTAFNGAALPALPPSPVPPPARPSASGGLSASASPSKPEGSASWKSQESPAEKPASAPGSPDPELPVSTPSGPSPPPGGPPPPPAWYNEARQAAKPMRYDSDDEN
ncbi:hypothetical protein GPECTOR_4g953 [Gonium pectorale]|uniref:BAR domain-containing protein n=1 Tax=Gonium pectorale TaxID=33097 RepID=A0A150GYH1_GONPE|nr:hypothetical protein GPECTOR_4g953 [Gonium pectorale]|eukprot:KXZ54881.1 hypothetical protein GPECTOR_4g953 [Gonium pectorale]